jgi:hypothetical protein
MAIPNKYMMAGEGAIASYSYTDIANGFGYNTLYLFTSKNNTTTSYGITGQILRSKDITLSLTGGNAGGTTTTSSLTFETSEFNLPRRVKGKAIVSFSTHFLLGDTGRTGYVTVYLSRYDGTTDTALGNARTTTFTTNGEELNHLFEISLAGSNIKRGDVLRVKVELSVTGGSGGATLSTLYFGADPSDRDGTQLTPSTDNTTTQFKIDIPFKIDL